MMTWTSNERSTSFPENFIVQNTPNIPLKHFVLSYSEANISFNRSRSVPITDKPLDNLGRAQFKTPKFHCTCPDTVVKMERFSMLYNIHYYHWYDGLKTWSVDDLISARLPAILRYRLMYEPCEKMQRSLSESEKR